MPPITNEEKIAIAIISRRIADAAVLELHNGDLDRVDELVSCYRLLGILAKGELFRVK